jgi:hypothetical protein
MAAAYSLDSSPLAMSKIKKKVVETMAAISERSSLADCCVYRNLMEAKNRLGILIKRLGSDVALERKPAATKTTAPPAARGTKRPSAKRSDDRRRACKKRATADAKEAREKQLKLSEVDITFDIADCKDRADLSGCSSPSCPATGSTTCSSTEEVPSTSSPPRFSTSCISPGPRWTR